MIASMEIRQLEYFLAVADHGQFTRAASSTRVTQPALSMQIRSLEKEVGVPLFDRVGRSITLTEAGRVLQHHARRVLGEIEEARSRIDDLRHLERGTLTIGCVPSVNAYFMPEVLATFRHRHPGIALKLAARRSGEVLEGVLDGRYDLGVEFLPSDHRGVKTELLFEERYVLVVPPDHPLGRRRRVRFESLRDCPLVLLPADHRIRQSIDAAARGCEIELVVSVEVDTIAELHALAGRGVGFAFLPRRYVEDLEGKGVARVVEVVDPEIVLGVGVIRHETRYLSGSAREFLDLLFERSEANGR